MSEKKEKNRNAIYTAIFSNSKPIDNLKSFEKMENWDYILFTNLDPKLFSETPWTVIQVRKYIFGNQDSNTSNTSNVMNARYVKWLGGFYLNSYDNLIWTDAYIVLNKEKEQEISYLLNNINNNINNNIIFKEHPHRNCIYEECKAVIKLNKDTKYKVSINMSIFLKDNMPKNFGLYETNIIIYKNTKENREFFKKVFEFMINKSYRDQLSLTYNIWKHNFKNFIGMPYESIQQFIRLDSYYSSTSHDLLSYRL